MFDKLKKEMQIDDVNHEHDTLISDKFWISDKEFHAKEFERTKGNCCFNHQIGLPKIKREPYNELPILDYEMQIICNIEHNKYYALNKARGIGATEVILRLILFKALHNDIPSRKFLIIPGTRAELAREYIRRIGTLCNRISYRKSKTQDKILIGKSEIIAMPADPDAIRGYENVAVIFADEAAHWDLQDDDPVLEAIEPHRTKSDSQIIIVSTPNGPRGFFGNIFSSAKIKYFKDTMPWHVAEGLLISKEEVEQIKKDDYFRYEQEYNCKFLSTKYSAFPQEVLEIARMKSEEYQLMD